MNAHTDEYLVDFDTFATRMAQTFDVVVISNTQAQSVGLLLPGNIPCPGGLPM